MKQKKPKKDGIEKRVYFAMQKLVPEISKMLDKDWGIPQKRLYPDDNTMQIDLDVDDRAIKLLKANKNYTKDYMLTEEQAKKGKIINPDGEYKWKMDLLDGSTNYNAQIPFYATSIAIGKDESIAGSVVHAPSYNQLFYAIHGKGAFIGDKLSEIYKPIHVSETKDLKDAKVSTVSSNSFKKHGLLGLLQKIQDNVKSNAQLGATALEFAYTAMGAFDGIVKPTKNPWGVSAGILLVEEAGGKVTIIKYKAVNIHVASNPQIHDALCKLVEQYLSEQK